MSDKPSDIILTITIAPAVNGKRKIIVSGAPEKEMPVVRTGMFPDLHRLLDETWVELMKRQPQIVTIKEARNAAKEKKSAKKGDDEGLDVTDEIETLNADGDQSDADDEESEAQADTPTEPEDLTTIEGDDEPDDHKTLGQFNPMIVEKDSSVQSEGDTDE